MGPMVGVKVSKEGSEHSQFRHNMSRERNEHAVKSGIEGMRKGYFTPALLFPIKKKERKRKKKKKKKKKEKKQNKTKTKTIIKIGTPVLVQV